MTERQVIPGLAMIDLIAGLAVLKKRQLIFIILNKILLNLSYLGRQFIRNTVRFKINDHLFIIAGQHFLTLLSVDELLKTLL